MQGSVLKGNYGISVLKGNYGIFVLKGNYGISVLKGNYGISVLKGNYGISVLKGNYGIPVLKGNYGIYVLKGNYGRGNRLARISMPTDSSSAPPVAPLPTAPHQSPPRLRTQQAAYNCACSDRVDSEMLSGRFLISCLKTQSFAQRDRMNCPPFVCWGVS